MTSRDTRISLHCMPPAAPTYRKFSLFTAGSIEMGAAVQWQQLLAEHLRDLPITITNPRRGQWDPNVDAKSEDPDFAHQVEWELDALTEATVICFFFDIDTLSPITLMELGKWADSDKIIVCCDKRFWRSGNVDIFCNRYNIPRVNNFKSLVPAIREMLERKGMGLGQDGNVIGENTRPKKLSQESDKPKKEQWWLKYNIPETPKDTKEAKTTA